VEYVNTKEFNGDIDLENVCQAPGDGCKTSPMSKKRGANPSRKTLSRRKAGSPGANDKGHKSKFVSPGISKKFSPAKIAANLAAQKLARKVARQRRNAYAARDSYKPRKSDAGKFVMIGTKGQRNPQAKGRKGYLVYVTKTGKKWLAKRGGKRPFLSGKISELNPGDKRLAKAAKQFRQSKLRTFQGKPVLRTKRPKAKGDVETAFDKQTGKESERAEYGETLETGGKGHDFSDAMVRTLTSELETRFGQTGRKTPMLFTALLLLESGEVVQVQIAIPTLDKIQYQFGGLRAFIRGGFYASLAQQLAFLGYVTSGSANHIRRVTGKKFSKANWQRYHDKTWTGKTPSVVTITRIDWKLEESF